MNNFAKSLIYYRKQNNMTQKDLADQLGISKSAISMYENGNREPDLTCLISMADFFEVDLDLLVQNKETKKDEVKLNLDEKKALDLYRQLSKEDKAEIRGEMKGMIKSYK